LLQVAPDVFANASYKLASCTRHNTALLLVYSFALLQAQTFPASHVCRISLEISHFRALLHL